MSRRVAWLVLVALSVALAALIVAWTQSGPATPESTFDDFGFDEGTSVSGYILAEEFSTWAKVATVAVGVTWLVVGASVLRAMRRPRT